jgi:hypothetical protein
VGVGNAETAVGPVAAINSNGSGNDDSSMKADNEPRVGSKLASPNAYASEPIVNESGSCIFRYYRSMTRYVVISFFSQLEVLQCNDVLNGVFTLLSIPQLQCWRLSI